MMEQGRSRMGQPRERRTRRALLRTAGYATAGIAGSLLLACGGGSTKQEGASTRGAAQAQQAAATAVTPKRGGRLQYYSSDQPPNLDPMLSLSVHTHTRVSLVYNKLAKLVNGNDKYESEIVPDLAEKWESTPDGLTWTFKLRPGVTWANVPPLAGRPLVAEDVVYTIRRLQSPQAPNKSRYAMIDKVAAPDAATVTVTLSYPHPQFLFNLAAEPSEIVPREAVEQKGDLKNWGAGTGPFIMTRYEPASIISYDRNPDHFLADKIYMDGVDINVIADKAAAVAAFRAGKIDIIGHQIQHAYTRSDRDAILKTNPGVKVYDYLANQVTAAVEMRYGAEPFTDVRVRRAINHALNRDAYIAALAEGEGAYTGTFPYHKFADYALPIDELKKLVRYDPKLSKQLLAEAGYPNGFSAKVMWEPARKGILDVSLEMLKAVGINLDTASEAVDYPAWVSKTYNGQFSHLVAWSYGVGGIWDYVHGLHHSTGNRNGPQTKIPELDTKIDQALHTAGQAKQAEMVKDIERYVLTDGLWILPIYTIKGYTLVQPWVQNFSPPFGVLGVYTIDYLSWLGINK